jgi:nucleotide-binding universal stress UspA family protein
VASTDGTLPETGLHKGTNWWGAFVIGLAGESGREAGYLIEAAVFELRMAGIAAAGNVRPAIVDRVAEAILAEAEAFGADLIVLGSPRRGEVATRLFGSVTLRVLRRSSCPAIVAPRRGPRRQPAVSGQVRGQGQI